MTKYLTSKDKYNEINDYDEYYLIKQKNVYKFIIEINQDELIIKHKYYSINMNNNDLLILTKLMLNNINDPYEYIINIFEQNKVIIKEIKFRKKITLLLKVSKYKFQKDIEIILLYNKENIFKNEIKDFKNEINILKKEIDDIKNNINNKKDNINNIKQNTKPNNNKLINYSNPEKIEFSNIITKDSYTGLVIDNAISVFKSIDDILLLIYTNKNKSIFSYNIPNNQILNEIKNAHDETISNIQHYFDSINNKDLILRISCYDKFKIMGYYF